MASFQRFEDIEVWQKARKLCNTIYPRTIKGSFERDYKLRDQINGASGSIMDNIAEGYERWENGISSIPKYRKRFLW
jgi:four helix bundle protein